MFAPAARLGRLLHTSLLVLLVLGAMVRPMLNQISELHSTEHAVLADADGHTHEHGQDHDPGDHDPSTDPDHTKGTHGLLHHADSHASAGFWTAWTHPASPPRDALLLPARTSFVPSLRLTSPFRPPIA